MTARLHFAGYNAFEILKQSAVKENLCIFRV